MDFWAPARVGAGARPAARPPQSDGCWGALLDSANVQGGRSEGHLFPAHLMPERDVLRLKPAVRFEWQSQHGKERPYSAIIALRRIGLSDPDNFFGSDSPIRPTI